LIKFSLVPETDSDKQYVIRKSSKSSRKITN